MGSLVLTNARVEFDGNNISAYVKSVSLPMEVEQLDDTAMGDSTKVNIAGMKNWSAQVTLHQDFAAAGIDSIIWGLFDAKTVGTLKVRPTTGAISTSNPEYSGDCFITNYDAISGGVGDKAEATISFTPAKGGSGSPSLARATA